MTGELTHDEAEELLGAYALDAVSPEEAETIGRYLRDCPRCRAEVAVHREVAASLAQVGAPAPDGVWQRIAGSLEETPPQLDLARVVGIGSRSRPESRWRGVAATAAAAIVAASVIGVLGVKVVDQDRRLRTLSAEVEGRTLESTALAALADPRSRRVALTSLDDKVSGQAVLLADGTGYLVASNLPGLPDDRTYQLWALVGEARISLGVLGPEPSATAFTAVTDMRALAVTSEPAGGVTSTTNPPVMMGWVPDSA